VLIAAMMKQGAHHHEVGLAELLRNSLVEFAQRPWISKASLRPNTAMKTNWFETTPSD
jgi:hypothetical protein